MFEPSWKSNAERMLQPIRAITAEKITESVGETGVDILNRQLEHIEDKDAVTLLSQIATSRTVLSFGTRFAGGNELSIQPSRMLGELGYSPTSDVKMRQSSFITVFDIERAVGLGNLRVGMQPKPAP